MERTGTWKSCPSGALELQLGVGRPQCAAVRCRRVDVKIDCPEAGRAFRPGSPGTDVPVDGRQLPRARRPSVSSRERPIRYARRMIWASSRLMVARLGAAPLAVALEYPNHGVTHAGSTTGINDR